MNNALINKLNQFLAFAIGSVPALVLTVPHGAPISALLLVVLASVVCCACFNVPVTIARKEYLLFSGLLILPCLMLLDSVLHHSSLRYLDNFTRFILVIPVYFAIRKSDLCIIPFFYGILLGALGAGCVALYQMLFIHEENVHGFVMKIDFGNISLLLSLLSFMIFLMVRSGLVNISGALCLVATVIAFTASALSGSRGGWLALPVFGVLLVNYFPLPRWHKIYAVFGFMLLVTALYFFSEYIQSRVTLAGAELYEYFYGDRVQASQTSVGARLEMWHAALILWSKQPFFGVGAGCFAKGMLEEMEAGTIVAMPVFEHAHSEFFHFMAVTGSVGVVAYFLFYVALSGYFFASLSVSRTKIGRYLSLMGLLLIISYFVFGFTHYAFAHQASVLFLAVMSVVFAAFAENSRMPKAD